MSDIITIASVVYNKIFIAVCGAAYANSGSYRHRRAAVPLDEHASPEQQVERTEAQERRGQTCN
jgi:hypothetical protein